MSYCSCSMLEVCHLRRMNKSGKKPNLASFLLVLCCESRPLSSADVQLGWSQAAPPAGQRLISTVSPGASVSGAFFFFKYLLYLATRPPWFFVARGTEMFLTELASGQRCAVAADILVAADAHSQEAIWVGWPWPAWGRLSIVMWLRPQLEPWCYAEDYLQ